MVVIRWAEATIGRRVKVDGPQCGGLYKEDNESIIPWSGTDPDAKMNSFTCSTEENYWIFLGGQYNEAVNNWKGPVNNGQFRQQNIKECGSSFNRGSSASSDIICHKCGNKGHIQKDCRSKGNGSSVNTPKKSINELPK